MRQRRWLHAWGFAIGLVSLNLCIHAYLAYRDSARAHQAIDASHGVPPAHPVGPYRDPPTATPPPGIILIPVEQRPVPGE